MCLCPSGTSSHMNLFRKRSHRFTSFQKKGFHYINSSKQLIMNFYNCINDNFNAEIVIVLLLFISWLKNKLWVATIYF